MPQAHAGILTLTPDGVADGFTLSQFAYLNSGYENSFGFGPFGVAYAGSGTVIVSSYANNTIYSFKDIDGQTVGSALNTVAGVARPQSEWPRSAVSAPRFEPSPIGALTHRHSPLYVMTYGGENHSPSAGRPH